jgi:hypothetical protein
MRALARAKTERGQLFALLTKSIGGRVPSHDALVLLREHWLAGVNLIELRFVGGRIVKQFDGEIARIDPFHLDVKPAIRSIDCCRLIRYAFLNGGGDLDGGKN